MLGPAGADHGEAVHRLGAVDGMAAGDGNAGRRAYCSAALEDFAHHLGRDLVDGHAEDRQRQDRLAAHGVDVGDGVGGGDAAEVEGVVDHRHEEVGGGDDAGVVVELPHRGVVGGLGADQQLLERRDRRLVGQQLLQHGWGKLAAAAAAVREAGEADLANVHALSPCKDAVAESRSAVLQTGLAAGLAPGGEEVDQHDAAGQLRQLVAGAFEIRERESL